MLSPAQNMARLVNVREIGRMPAVFTPDMTSIGTVLWYQRGLIADSNVRFLFLERTVGANNAADVLQIMINTSPSFAASVRATDSGGALVSALSALPVPDTQLVPIVLWRTPTQVGISVDGETPVTTAFTPPSPAITSTYGLLGIRDISGTGQGAPDPVRFAPGDYFSLGYYRGTDGTGSPFTLADIAAIKAAGPVAYANLPVISNGTLLAYYEPDAPVVLDRVGGVKTLRFRCAPTWVRPPVTRSSGAPAWNLGFARSFGEGPTAFSFEAAVAPVFREPPRRILCDATTKGSRSTLVMSGNSAWDLSIQSWSQPPGPGESAPDSTIYSEPGTNGTWDWLLVGGRYSSIRYRDSGGVTLYQHTATEGQYRERAITARSSQELTNNFGGELRTRLDMTVAAGHDMAEGQVIRLTDAGWPGDHVVTYVSDNDAVVSIVRNGHGHPLPSIGSIVYGTQDEIGAGETGSFDSFSINLPRAIGLHVERLADGTINHYARGRLIGTGTISTSLVGSATGAVAWLGGAPGDGPAATHNLLGILSGVGLSAAKKAEFRQKINLVVEGRDGWRDDVVFMKTTEAAPLDRVAVIDHPAQWHVINPDGTDHDPRVHADTGQSRSRATGHFSVRKVGSHDLAADTTFPTTVAIWPRTVNRGGTLNPGRTGAPTVIPVPITRRARNNLFRNVYVSNTVAGKSDAANNDGTNPATPLATMAVAIARAGPFDDICLTPGDFFDVPVDMRPLGVFNDRAAGRVRIHTLGAGTPAKFRRFVFAHGVRNVAELFDLQNAEADQTVLNLQVFTTGLSGSAVRDITVTNTASNGTHVGFSAIPPVPGTYGSFADIRVRNLDSAPPDSGPYGYFMSGMNYFSMVGCDIQMTAHAGGGHPMRLPGFVYGEISHMPSLPPGFAQGTNRQMSFRGNARHVYVSDIGNQIGRFFAFTTAPPRIDSRSNFSFARMVSSLGVDFMWGNGATIQHARQSSSNVTSPNSGGQTEHVVARVRAMGVQQYGSNNVPYVAATLARFVPDSGPWRYQTTASSQDFGAAICPDVGSVHVNGAKVLIRSEGFPLGGLVWPKLEIFRRPAGDLGSGVKVEGSGADCVLDTPGPGQWEYRFASGGGAAFGAWSTTATVSDGTTPVG